MKHELNAQPACFKEAWPRQLEIFSWIDYVTAIPQAMIVITTWKEGQIPNACLKHGRRIQGMLADITSSYQFQIITTPTKTS